MEVVELEVHGDMSEVIARLTLIRACVPVAGSLPRTGGWRRCYNGVRKLEALAVLGTGGFRMSAEA